MPAATPSPRRTRNKPIGSPRPFARRPLSRRLILLALGLALCGPATGANEPLALEAVIPLPDTAGRIDHLGIDLARKRLLVAELGQGAVDVVDLDGRGVVHRIAGLREPQGVLHVPKADLIAVASAGDGTVRLFAGNDFSPRGVVALGDDADNLRLDPRTGDLVAGYGNGGLATIDPVRAAVVGNVALSAHPEGFRIAPDGRAYANVPNARRIEVADLATGRRIAQWPTPGLAGNFPMELGFGGSVAAVFRSPARLVRFDPADGRVLGANDTCGDADDVFFDARRSRYYVSCGSGAIDAFQATGDAVARLASIPTAPGARTSLFVPELDRLYLAVRAGLLGSNAAIHVFRPIP